MVSANFRDIQRRFCDNPGWAPQRRELELVATLTERRIDMGSKTPEDHFYHLFYAQHNNVQEMRQALNTPSEDPFIFRYILDEFVFTEHSIVQDWNMSRLGGVAVRIPEADIPNEIKNFPLRSAADDLLSHEGRAWIPPNLPLRRRTFGNGLSFSSFSAPIDQVTRPEPAMAQALAPDLTIGGTVLKNRALEKPLPFPPAIAVQIASKNAAATGESQISGHALITNNASVGLDTSTMHQARSAPLVPATVSVTAPATSQVQISSYHSTTRSDPAAFKDNLRHQAQIAPLIPPKRTTFCVGKISSVRNPPPLRKASPRKTSPRKANPRKTSPRKMTVLDTESSSDEDRSFRGSKRAIAQGRKNARTGTFRRSGRAQKPVYTSLDDETLFGNEDVVDDDIDTTEEVPEMTKMEIVNSDFDNHSEASTGHIDTMSDDRNTMDGKVASPEQHSDAAVKETHKKPVGDEKSELDLSDVPDDLSDQELDTVGQNDIRDDDDYEKAVEEVLSASSPPSEGSYITQKHEDQGEVDIYKLSRIEHSDDSTGDPKPLSKKRRHR
ncbi:hypothetical protein PMIN01_10813 [Paraphaeosphaeria minitans]|uniref:Uncharacterized protein n=1 Tax=Paraphaeosphaeria minitans TaxID=565426 RepID=A0A9P6KLH8_9PLEO|nr:hypothetical protein PMIN01_10813 [Paraphaeosphaeria minitans]